MKGEKAYYNRWTGESEVLTLCNVDFCASIIQVYVYMILIFIWYMKIYKVMCIPMKCWKLSTVVMLYGI